MHQLLDHQTGELVTVKVAKRKSNRDQPTLFPGWQLNRPIKNLQSGACVIGHIFEKVTQGAIGGECRTTDSASDLSPDLADERNNLLIESKAFGMNKSHRCARGLFEHGQLDNYINQQDFKHVHYAIWNYSHPKPVGSTKPYPTEGIVVNRVLSTLVNGYILDISILERMRQLEKKFPGINYRHCKLYFIGRPIIYRDYMVAYRSFFEALRTSPAMTLLAMGLVPDNYNWSESKRLITLTYDGLVFKTRRFPLFKIARKLVEVPF